jgi:hypothetical protein
MKKFIYLSVLLIMGLVLQESAMKAQPERGDRKSQLEIQKIAFITKKLDLSVVEAQKFWPVYNEFEKKREEIHKSRRQMMKKIKEEESKLSDDELMKISDEYISLQIKEGELISEYHQKFKQVLPGKKMIAYYQSEEQFKMWLLREMRNKPVQKNP